MQSRRRTVAAGATALFALAAVDAPAQQQIVKPPVAQYWMDVATHTMAGMPEMPSMPGLPSFMGGGGGSNAYGNTRGMSMGRWLDLALYTRSRPSGTEATHAIPAGMQMGPNLPLLPLQAAPKPTREPEDPPEEMRERPTGRVLIYWGCGETVRTGQPRVIDLASAGPAEFGRAFGGRYVPERGARVAPGYSLWPNEKSRTMVPREASLAGEHAVAGEGVPASLRFAIAQTQDFMPAIQLESRGTLADSIALQWPALATARGYYLHAMASIGADMVLWSSSETPDTGMGLVDYLPNATIDRWVREKVLLPASQTRCAVPKGIFGGGRDDGAMLRMIAYGSELNLVHPPRPADPRTPWEPDWSARVRVKSTTMSMLGTDMEATGRGGGARRDAAGSAGDQPQGKSDEQKSTMPSIPGLPGAGRAIESIRGIFGR